ncbi:MAG: ComEC family competence protein, partial [Rickettsiales bacterium]|nr:ComEC family competence protein [Rickettsiales bacterium]
VEFFPNRYRVTISNIYSEEIPKINGKIILNVAIDEYEKFNTQVGNYITFIADITPLSKPVFIGDFDYTRYSFYRGISAGGQITKIISYANNDNKTFSERVKNFRINMTKYIKSHMSKDGGDVALTLITGERYSPSKKIQNDYKNSGVSHILSISGFHMTVIASLVFVVVRLMLVLLYPLSSRYDMKNFAYIITLIALTSYLFLSGARLSTQRAYIMAVASLFALMTNKSPVSIRLLLFAGLIILMMTPESLVNAGFELSFMAVLALIVVFKLPLLMNFTHKLQRKSRIAHGIFMAFLTTMVASFATSILVLYHFQEYQIWGVITNMVTTPIFVLLIMPMIIIFLIANTFLPTVGLDIIALKILDFGIALMNYTTEIIAGFPYRTIYVNYMGGWVAAVFVMGLIMIALLKNKYKIIGFFLTLVAIVCMYSAKNPDVIINQNGNVFIANSRWSVINFNILPMQNYSDDGIQNYAGSRENLRTRISIAKRFNVGAKNIRFEKFMPEDVFYIGNIKMRFYAKNIHNIDIACVEISKWNRPKEYCLTQLNVMEIYFDKGNYKLRF